MAVRVDAPPSPPPVAPHDPQELLQVLQAMPPPRRRLVVFKGGGYVYSQLEDLISAAGLGHVVRVTNLMRKAHCVLAKPAWDSGRRVDLRQHRAAAANARVPFLTVERLDAAQLAGALRPALVAKRLVVEPGGRHGGG